MAKKLHKLNVQEIPFLAIAIVCSETHLKTAWLLNTKLGFEFRELNSCTVALKAGNKVTFPAQVDDTSNPELHFLIIKNKVEGQTLIKSLANIDYLLKVEGEQTGFQQKQLIKKIKSIPEVLGAMLLEEKKTKELSILRGL